MTPKPIILPYQGILPKIHPTALIMPGAVIIGDVEIGEESNIWPGCVIRGDINYIRIGKRTNIQDGTVIHVTRQNLTAAGKGMTMIGDDVTVGHQAVLHACTLENASFVGMGATVIDGVVVQSGAMVAAGAMVTYGKVIPSGEIWAGNPAKLLRLMKQTEKDYILQSAQNYVNDAQEYLKNLS
ncbi:MAG: gamma carbonic anhydrase family protein [Proteobacteria bacterium]|nr:gamma carbonic anhydrase family protein [Pseudomonadota bacterium]